MDTEIEINPLLIKKAKEALNLTDIAPNIRTKTSMRLKYEAEADIISKNIGSLNEIRDSLNLSQRKMCQLLLVDPSAWTRWTKGEGKVPPHIYRSLQWYLALIEKSPQWHPQNAFLGAFRNDKPQFYGKTTNNLAKNEEYEHELKALRNELMDAQQRNYKFIDQMRREVQIHWGWKFVLMINILLLVLTWVF